MKKTIAIISCADTKLAEMMYVREQIEALGCAAIICDTSTRISPFESETDILQTEIAAAADFDWSKRSEVSKDVLLDVMCRGIEKVIPQLYETGRIHGAVSLGGLQNTIIGTAGLRSLPIGVPKLMVSTVATGKRTFDFVTGTKDVVVMPSISDFAGVNSLSRVILKNAAAAICGMVLMAGETLQPPKDTVIATTLMGATNDGVVQAVELLQNEGFEVLSFHSTGFGGKTMEEMIRTGTITAVMDLTLHEIVYEYFGKGFGSGTKDRLSAAAETGIPMVVCPAGIDFICLYADDPFPDLEKRQMIWHNPTLKHVRLLPKEVKDICRIIIDRLNTARGPVTVVMPERGFRSFTEKGEGLYNPEIDALIMDMFRQNIRKDIPIKAIDCNFMDMNFSELAAKEMQALIGQRGGI